MLGLFVYGSLLDGEPNHARLSGATLLGVRTTSEDFELVDLGAYPALVRTERGQGRSVRGELYRAWGALLEALDVFEGHPELYERRRIHLASGERAFAYVMSRRRAAGAPRIECACWRQHRASTAVRAIAAG